jgi:NADH-quinone oxidoreductase subunit H
MVEYSATPYMLFMLAEYVAIITMCALTTFCFSAAGCRGPVFSVHRGSRPDLVYFEGLPGFHDSHGKSHRA